MNTKEDLSKDGIQQRSMSSNRNIIKIVQLFCLKTFSAGVSYLAGLSNVSLCWFFGTAFLFMYRDYWRLQQRFKQQVAMAISLKKDRQMFLVNVNPASPWVHFPEMEQSEWLNKIVFHMWPSMTKYTEDVMKNTVEPIINQALSAYKKNPNFTFYTSNLGSIVPRICGLKVHKNSSRLLENIILDIRLFYIGDTQIYFYLMSLGGGVQNIEISGWIRIVLKIVVEPIPFVGGIEIFFLHRPKVEFDFSGAMDILKIPGISGMLRRTVDDQLSSRMVLPNKITIKMNDIVDSGYWKCPDPEGLVRIHVIEAKDLRSSGSSFFGSGTSDSYVMMNFGSQTFYSEIFENSLNPEWNFWANFMIDSYFDEHFLITVNERGGNESLGKILIELSLAKEKKFMRSWVQLEDTSTGMIHLEIYYYNLSYHSPDMQNDKLAYTLIVFINTAFNLENPRSNKTPNSSVHLEIGKATRVSKSVLSNNPVFEETFLFVANGDPKICKLKLKLVDTNTNTALGNATLLLKRVFEANNMEVIDQTCPLMNTALESSLSLSMRIRIIKH